MVKKDRTVKDRIRLLYNGQSKRATRFRYGLLAFDAVTIMFFIGTAPLPMSVQLMLVDVVLGILILADLSARMWIATDRLRFLRQVYVIADIAVLASLVLAPLMGQTLGVLRVLRALRLIHSYHVLRDLRRDNRFFRLHEDAIVAAVNLFVFVFMMTAVVFFLRGGEEPGLTSYVDALYFTVAALTTTGFGDIVLSSTTGKVLSVVIMVFGVALFMRLARAIFVPAKIKYKCPECGLSRHDPDAIHCKHCGHELKIETEGAGA
ncbi:ion channel [Sediminimonas sp.]|uniref:ion channel n=1 Tax=Sediminimonas sp. TaxID=2823379 RepID=UPI0025F2E76F|nr:ion channel [Sediminimonas sp.]